MYEERLIEKINVDLNCDRKCELCEKFFLCENEIKWEMAKRGRMHKAREVMSQIKRKIAVAGGKGGVGKSAVAVNLATALAMKGYKVSILDHDFDGPCVPKMLGVKGQRLKIGEKGIIPCAGLMGMQIISMGLITKSEEVLTWFHEMRRNATEEFLSHVDYGARDFLIVDLPPGTSSDAVNLMEYIPDLDGTVVVTVHSEVSQDVARKATMLCFQARVKVFGIIENMSGYVCPECGKTAYILQKGGGELLAHEMRVPFLGRVPLDPRISSLSDQGVPIVYQYPDSEPSKALIKVAEQIEREVNAHA